MKVIPGSCRDFSTEPERSLLIFLQQSGELALSGAGKVQYAELHCHSAFSLLDGASNPEELLERASLIGLNALALTDHDDMGGAVRFAHAGRELGIDAIIGAELSMDNDEHLIVLAKSLAGYKNICRLITAGRMNSKRGLPRVSMQLLSEHAGGILALSGCPHGRIPSLLARGRYDEAVAAAAEFRDIFGEDFFLELWDHGLAQEAYICKQLYEISGRLAIPWLVTNNAHYAYPQKRIIHDLLICLKHELTLSTAGRRLRPNGSWYLKSAQEIYQQWRQYPEGIKNTLLAAERCQFRLGLLKPELPQIDLSAAQDYLNERAAYCLKIKSNNSSGLEVFSRRNSGGSEKGPHYPAPAESSLLLADASAAYAAAADLPAEELLNATLAEGRSESKPINELLLQLSWLGAQERYGKRLCRKQIKQLKHELSLIFKLDLSPYFLIMWDIIRFADSQGIAVQGRGSAANSAVCYCLKITAVDPVEMDLLFERFISEDRNEPPDIDIDIAHMEREKVLQYVYEKYGRMHAAMVCEHITYRAASAVRDAARVLDFSVEQAERLVEQVRYHEAGSAAQVLADGGALKAGLDPADKRVQILIQAVAGLHQLPRHRSIHVGGFVLSGEPIGAIVPVEPASMDGRTVIQWDKDDIDLAGLIKIDLLGLGMLTMIQESLKLIEKQRGFKLDLSQLDMTDPNIYEMLRKADTIGVFQVESRAQMSILPKIKPNCFYDIVVSIAIVRPGPIQGNIVHPYLRRRRGLEPVEYLHPSLEPILKRTLGVPLFQEQGMKLAVVAAGFSPSQADQLRRVMSHKRSVEKMAEVCVQLAEGMKKKGLSQEAIETITFQLKAFANYGFPESHAASFALLVFASAYIKLYFAPEFYCAILNAQPMGFYSPATLIRDALRHGVEVRPIDLAFSSWDCTLEKGAAESAIPALRLGLRFVSGLGAAAKQALEVAWQEGGAFQSLEDIVKRSGLGAKDLERLALAGAFESFSRGRRQTVWKLLKLAKQKNERPLLKLLDELLEIKEPQITESGAQASQSGTQAGPHASHPEAQISPPSSEFGTQNAFEFLPTMSDLELCIADYKLTGLSTSKHPMIYFRSWAKEKQILSCAELALQTNGSFVWLAGSVICRQKPHTAKGFVFITIEDESGTANIIIRPQIFAEYKDEILKHNFILVSGRLQLEDSALNLIASSVKALPRLAAAEDIPVVSRNFH